MTASLWVYLVFPTANYVHYYSAIEDLSIKIPSFIIDQSDTNVTVTLIFNVSNPTPYVGLSLASVSYQALIQDNTMATSGTGPPAPLSIKPFSFQTLTTSFVMTGAKKSQYEMLVNQSGGTPQWHVTGTASILGKDGFLTPQFDIPVMASSK